jgi:predicted component of type VI protein secretion system
MFEGIWVMIPHVEKSYLAQKNTILGTNLTLGQRVYCQDYGISVQLYTKNVTQFTMFLPNGLYYSFLKQMICLYVGLKFFVSIGLHIDHPPQGRMGRRQEFPLMLGWTSFLKPLSKERQNAFQVRYH